MNNITSKKSITNLLLRNSNLSSQIPKITTLSPENLESMLASYKVVYIKPDSSPQGKGTFLVEKSAKKFNLLFNNQLEPFQGNLDELWNELQPHLRKRAYIIQQGIKSYTPTEEPCDIYTHLLRLENEWKHVGSFARKAAKGYITANNTGQLVFSPLDSFLQGDLGLSVYDRGTCKQELVRLSIQIAKTISKTYPFWSEFGLDFALDEHKKLWLLQLDISPSLRGFKIAEPITYQKIVRIRNRAK